MIEGERAAGEGFSAQEKWEIKNFLRLTTN